MSSNTLAQFYQIFSIVAFSLAGVFFAFGIFWFFKFNILKIINDLTGRTAKKTIAKRRIENEKTGNKSFRPTPEAQERGTITDKIEGSDPTEALPEGDPTEILGEQTELLGNETELLGNETTVIGNETELLTDEKEEVVFEKLKMIQDITLVHTNETI